MKQVQNRSPRRYSFEVGCGDLSQCMKPGSTICPLVIDRIRTPYRSVNAAFANSNGTPLAYFVSDTSMTSVGLGSPEKTSMRLHCASFNVVEDSSAMSLAFPGSTQIPSSSLPGLTPSQLKRTIALLEIVLWHSRRAKRFWTD